MEKERREALNLTQRGLAELVYISYLHVAYIEIGSSFPSTETLLRLASTLGFSIDALLDNDPTFNREDRDKMEQILRAKTPENRTLILETVEFLADRLEDR